jgi:5-methylthioadenosine/S-adenosylhomocysteine deaminase
MRGYAENMALSDWLNRRIFPFEAKLDAEAIYNGTLLAAAEMLRFGIVSTTDMYFNAEAVSRAVVESGIKMNFSHSVTCFDDRGIRDLPMYQENLNNIKLYHHAADGRMKMDLSIHAEYTSTEKVARGLAEMAKEYKTGIHVHVSETRREHEECMARHGKTPVAYLADTGLLDHGAYAAHCVWASDDDFRIMREYGVTLVHNPSSNMKLGSGFARIAAAMAAGVKIALGTDGCASNDNLNMFEEMHLAALVHKGIAQDPTVLKAGDVLDMATVNAARALGRTDTGLIEVGRRADLCVVDLDRPHLAPALDIPNLLVYSAQAPDVVMTIVDGVILYDGGEFSSIYAEKAKYEFLSAVRRIGLA